MVATCALELPKGTLEVRVNADDNVRLFLDDKPLRGSWFPYGVTPVPIAAGRHTLRIEYFESNGLASLQVNLRAMNQTW